MTASIVMTAAQAELALSQMSVAEIEHALQEIERELQVRERCYPGWIDAGKLSKLDAKVRMNAQIKSREILSILLDIKSATQ